MASAVVHTTYVVLSVGCRVIARYRLGAEAAKWLKPLSVSSPDS